ncbi:MAG: ATP-binding cassette domain-containing protein [Acidimicrobiales bacterium]
MGTAPTAREGIRLVGLTKSFGAVRAVRAVDINVAPGQTLALLGPNGAGKSTTIDMMLGLSRPDSGTVTIFGVPPSDAVRAGLVGAMLQTGSLIEFLSVRELITMIAAMYPHPLTIDEVLSLVGMTNFANRPSNKLSGGQTQRVRMARRIQPVVATPHDDGGV